MKNFKTWHFKAPYVASHEFIDLQNNTKSINSSSLKSFFHLLKYSLSIVYYIFCAWKTKICLQTKIANIF
jgi:hypothetical protein